MKLSKAQKAWLLYDPAVSAYAMIVRTVVAPIFLAYFAAGILDEAKSTEYWGYACSIAGLVAGAISVFFGPKIDAGHKKIQAVGVFTAIGVLSTLAYLIIPWVNAPRMVPFFILVISFFGILGFMGANSFYDSLLINVTGQTERDKVSSIGFALGYAGALVSFLLCMPLMSIADGKYFFTGAFLIAALWWALFSFPLFKNVREKQSLCYYCAAGFNGFTSSMSVDSGVEHHNTQRTIDAVQLELKNLIEGEITSKEISETKLIIRNSLKSNYDGLHGLEAWYLNEAIRGTGMTPEMVMEKVDKVTEEDIRNVLQLLNLNVIYTLAK